MTQNKVELAEKLSKESHQGQKYGSHDYFDYHIKGVVNSLIEHQFSEVYIITALLHDSVEDTPLTLDKIESLFGKEVRDAVDALTKRETETREEYLIRCGLNPIARVVKLHDAAFNAHNSHKESNQSRVDYLQAMLIVSTAQDRLG
ncbi:HD domain-containing protein [Acinetobacter baumannii]|uniref:HD domain-containing protein n=1 Tax=Acinetobacter baumannii TaxID=470 RepID=UPI001CA82776|nr:HD domain-containing protein [Acinetobacter baumannii]UAB21385.1 HD domain-containing protein [Acinetobacter baumannii]UAB24826.1 HD domain-containing protein [Acinetobacter baumannii]